MKKRKIKGRKARREAAVRARKSAAAGMPHLNDCVGSGYVPATQCPFPPQFDEAGVERGKSVVGASMFVIFALLGAIATAAVVVEKLAAGAAQ